MATPESNTRRPETSAERDQATLNQVPLGQVVTLPNGDGLAAQNVNSCQQQVVIGTSLSYAGTYNVIFDGTITQARRAITIETNNAGHVVGRLREITHTDGVAREGRAIRTLPPAQSRAIADQIENTLLSTSQTLTVQQAGYFLGFFGGDRSCGVPMAQNSGVNATRKPLGLG